MHSKKEKNNTKTSAASPLSRGLAEQGSLSMASKPVTAAANNLSIDTRLTQIDDSVKQAILIFSDIVDAIDRKSSVRGSKKPITADNLTGILVANGIMQRHPCYLSFEEEHSDTQAQGLEAIRELERALADNQEYHDALENIHISYNAEMQEIRDDARRKIDYLLSELNRIRQNNDRLCKEIDNLWEENQRKSKIIDTFIDKL